MKKAVTLVIIVAILGLISGMPGCSKSHKSSRGASSGGGGGTGTGGTGTGGTGTGGTGTGGTGPASAVGVDLDVNVQSNADSSSLEALGNRIKGMQSALWTATEGQCYFKTITVKDNSSDQSDATFPKGRIYIDDPNSSSIGPGLPGAGNPGCFSSDMNGNGIIYFGGHFNTHVFMHEWGHFMNGRKEEYSCSVCYMSNMGDQGVYCDGSNCSVSDPCWDNYSIPKHGWKHPNQYDSNAPAVNVDVQDN